MKGQMGNGLMDKWIIGWLIGASCLGCRKTALAPALSPQERGNHPPTVGQGWETLVIVRGTKEMGRVERG
jgi:hypothetical protein